MTQRTDPDAAARNALRLLGANPPNWVPEHAGIDHSVTIVGGGQTGCAIAFALRRAGIGRVTIIDAAADEAGAGIWLNAARMNLLRTPKTLPGPELGIPALSFQGWYEARHGEQAYAAIDRIPRTDWAEYLRWYRHFIGIPIRYRTRLCRIEPADGHFRLHLEIDGQPGVETTRKVVLATGFTGYGGPYVPSVLTGSLPARFYAHTEDAIDFTALRGKVVAVIGAAASAFDAAGVALEAGAAAVHLFARRPAIAAVPISRSRGYPGAYDNYHVLPDATRWEQAVRYRRFGSTPTTDAIERAVAFANFHLHLASSWDAAREADGGIVARVNGTEFRCDFVIAGTGYHADLAGCPELAAFAGQVLLWRDRFEPPDDMADDWLGAHPYLGAGHEYLEKVPGAAPYLRDIHVQNPAGFVSFGVPTGDVPSMKRDIPAIVARISCDLFFADFEHHARRMTADVPPDFTEAAYSSNLSRATRG
ncbi:MAG TPA: NAD(P)-binding domain-containing protein [Acetobacteraceae bacterium]|nr:NAD(P)-binding domain-containing protein [Acetobacteraceae bacterium]